ncbi:Sugar kinase of the NBD/HSP70 family, may contain an N-terminal HTH domain [Agromyces sp. CF514]|uniref:ROK family transcriptional regulator n=1 Tax=Agromyces sp. CF514 TaxID=1881031 RepID=UPI0008E25364|nr:ROK family transcriptional regulator [Agromyces sp. CF514]SFR70423.1 Sugar kinase of the NBD/HSP70 family, may contain an N-terminal HTH domain [Agromyces sp. CF514]
MKDPIGGTSRVGSKGRNLEDLRRQNLSTVLSLVHANRSMTRADLTHATGLNRSTVATIVTELESLDLVTVSQPVDTKRVGRPSTVIGPSPRHIAVAVHPDKDAIAIGIVAMGGRVLREFRFDVEQAPSAVHTVNTLHALVRGLELSDGGTVLGIGIGVPGLVGARDGVVRVAPHLDWHDEPLVDMVAKATGLPTWAANDATCAVVAEGQFGQGVDEDNVVYLNGGAGGIGGGVIVGGQLLSGENGYSGELGHMLVNSDGGQCHCGALGCLETEVNRDDLLGALGLGDAEASLLEQRLREAYGTDQGVTELVDRQLTYLGVALRNFVNIFNPGVIVLGGFLGALRNTTGTRLQDDVERSALAGPASEVRIVSSTLEDNVLIGAGELVFRTILRDPTSASTSAVPAAEHVAAS